MVASVFLLGVIAVHECLPVVPISIDVHSEQVFIGFPEIKDHAVVPLRNFVGEGTNTFGGNPIESLQCIT